MSEKTMDFVQCNNCNFIGGIAKGDEICPICGMSGVMSWVDEDNQEMTKSEIESYLDRNYLTKDRLIERLEIEGCSQTGLQEIVNDAITLYITKYQYYHPVAQANEIGYIYVKTLDGIVELPIFENNPYGGYEQIETDFAKIVTTEIVEAMLSEQEERLVKSKKVFESWKNEKTDDGVD